MEPKKSSDVPATKGMVDETRAELKSDMTSLSLEMKSGFTAVNANFDEMGSKIEKVLSAVHSVKAIVEDQEARNKYVLDGYTSIHDRQDRLAQEVRQDIAGIKDFIARSAPPAG